MPVGLAIVAGIQALTLSPQAGTGQAGRGGRSAAVKKIFRDFYRLNTLYDITHNADKIIQLIYTILLRCHMLVKHST